MIDKKIPISDIAKVAHVSLATVSRVINHPDQVKATTLTKVQQVLTDLGYSSGEPDRHASGGKIIIAMLPSLGNPFYTEIINGAKSSSASHGYHLLVICEDHISDNSIQQIIEMLRHSKASGMIMLTRKMEPDLLERLDSIVPLVQCCEYNQESDVPYVSVDNYKAAKSVTDYLISTGRSKVAFINGPLSYIYAQERLRGFDDSLAAHGIEIPPGWRISLPDISYELGYLSICRLLGSPTPPNALFAASDVFAVGAIRAAKRFDMNVPQTLGIVGFDNIDITTMVTPSISTVNQPCFQMGFTACELLIQRIINPSVKPESELFDTELIIRESSLARP